MGYIFIVRHGERADQSPLDEEKKLISVKTDVHLTKVGHDQAHKTGHMIAKKLEELKKEGSIDQDAKVILLSSPYYRTLQTARMVAEGLDNDIHSNTLFVEVG